LVAHALDNPPPLPLVLGDPISSKPKKVSYKLHWGFFDVFVLGAKGERAFFHLPLCHLGDAPG
jgi:hypothetical protein